jgi:Spy/CpxP family protein refolding chaperone
MEETTLRRLRLALLVTAAVIVSGGAAQGQEIRRQAPAIPPASMGKGMGMITPSLIEIGMQTKFFLALGDRIKMTDEQWAQITEIAFQFQRFAQEKKGDLAVAEAELQRMLGRDQIDLAQVKAKLKEILTLQGDVEYAGVESLLKAIKALTHEQHLLIMTIATTPELDKQKWQ